MRCIYDYWPLYSPIIVYIYCSHVVELSDHTSYYYSFTSFLSSDATIMWFLAFCFSFTLFSEILYARDFSCFNQPILASAKPAEVPVKKSFWSRHTCKGMSAWKATCGKVLWTTPLCLTRVHARDTSRKMMWARNLQFTGRGKEFEVTQWLCYHSVSLFISRGDGQSMCVIYWYLCRYAIK